MSKKDIEYSARVSGIIYALNLAKKEGIEALENDVKKRNITKAPLNITQAQMDDFWAQLSTNMHTTMLCTVSMVLNQEYGFGKKRLHEFKEKWDQYVQNILDLDYIGEHYVTFQDYAKHLKDEYDLDINVDILDTCQKSYDDSIDNDRYHMIKAEKVVEILSAAGYEDAAGFIQEKIS